MGCKTAVGGPAGAGMAVGAAGAAVGADAAGVALGVAAELHALISSNENPSRSQSL